LLRYKGTRLPVYGDILTFLDGQKDWLEEEQSQESAGVRRQVNGNTAVRIGYDLFHEIRQLLSACQPHVYAAMPAVEIHIGLLRDLIVESGALLVEIPPIPEGYAFIACLTHDVDHPSIRRHRWDHTAWGFLYRALLGSVVNLLRGRLSFGGLVANWVAAAKLPLVYLGLANDFWLDFDRYLGFERQAGSTFFVLPFEGMPGRAEKGSAPRIRASGYGAVNIADQLHAIMKNGGEIGLHGIDAWIDSTQGQEEKTQIEQVTGSPIAGVRMHWLYFNAESPALLEKAGFAYDSTVGYNETIGYRAGTTQVYKPLNADHLLELPMHVMDTALFYPAHLGLSSEEAVQRVGTLIDNAVTWGGVLTFNWHDRSLAPERLWGEFYAATVRKVMATGAWCTTAGNTVAWYQQRRSVVFTRASTGIAVSCRDESSQTGQSLPRLRVRVYNGEKNGGASSTRYRESVVLREMAIQVG
ncbi:MAG: hypothetical protein OEY28_14145, partial [Nitrospira sp.]|nr:hypothetical protein [Nitrospira sp.]